MRLLLVSDNADAYSWLIEEEIDLIAINETRRIAQYVKEVAGILLERPSYDVALELAREFEQPCYMVSGERFTPVPRQKPHLLIVEDNREIASIYQRSLDRFFRLSWCDSADDALEDIEVKNVDVVLLDIMLGRGERDGLFVLDHLSSNGYKLPVIAISANHDFANDPSMKVACEFIAKPVSTVALRERVLRTFNQERSVDIKALKRRLLAAA